MTRHRARDRRAGIDFVVLLFVIAACGVAILAWLVLRPHPASVLLAPDAPLPRAEGHVMGSDSAPVEIVEFGDFECPTCGRFATAIEPEVRARLVRTGRARFRFLDFPLQSHPNTMFAHNAAACAGAQGKFWEMHDRLFAGQLEWSGLGVTRVPDAVAIMKQYARDLGLDTGAYDTCLDTRALEPQVRAAFEKGLALHVDGTPTFFVGNRMLAEALPSADVFEAIVDSLTTQARQGGGAPSGVP